MNLRADVQVEYPRGSKVYGRVGTDFEAVAGVVVGGYAACHLEGCLGVRVWVRWPDGRVTKPCSKSLHAEGVGWARIR